jgi:hypothetical protein
MEANDRWPGAFARPDVPDRDWNPQDGRVVRLGLRVHRDEQLEHDVEATIWARPADLDWPELRWLKRMSAAERSAFMQTHQAVLERAAATRRPRQATPSHVTRTPQPGPRARPPAALPEGVSELTTEADFKQAVAADSLIVKTDSASPPKLHFKPQACSGISPDNFRLKLIVGGGKNGRYYRSAHPASAQWRWPGLGVCGTCRQLDPAGAAAVDARLG